MGVVLDTSVVIDAERRGFDVEQMLSSLPGDSSQDVAVASMTLVEFAHGIMRIRTESRRERQEQFLNDLRAAVPVIALSDDIAIRAGRLDGALRLAGVTIGLADVVIAATAIESGYSVATLNGKHFRVVPGLDVVEL